MREKKHLESLQLNDDPRPINNPWRPVVIYMLIGFLWILFSDRILGFLVSDASLNALIQTFKGWFYVLVTGVILYFLVQLDNRNLIKLNQSIQKKNEELVAYSEETLAMEEELQSQLDKLSELMTEQSLQKDFLDEVIRYSNAAIVIWDLEGRVVDCNNFYLDMIGIGKEIIGTKSIDDLLPKDERIRFADFIETMKREKKVTNIESKHKHADGRETIVIWNDVLITNPVDNKEVVVAFGIDVTKERQAEEAIYQLAYYDKLTGLKNRILFEEDLQTFLDEDKTFNVYYIDVDNFKNLNDIHGHYYGDLFLKEFAVFLEKDFVNLRLYRWGGDEFVIIDPVNRGQDTREITTAIVKMTHRTWQLEDVEFHTSTSIGVVECPKHGSDVSTIFKNLEIALYKAKDRGKSRCVFFDSSFADEIKRKNIIEKEINQALEEGGFYLNFQPIYSLQTKEFIKLEALLRFKDAKGLNTNIGEMIGIAEQTGQIHKIDDWVLNEAFEVVAKEQNRFEALKVSINISAQTFIAERFIPYLQQLLDTHEVDPAIIELEITEHTILHSIKESKGIMQKLKYLGFGIALDDFGTRYSSLNYLSHLPFDVLKVDKSYVDNVTYESNDYKIVRQIITLAKDLGLKTVAEGIETAQQEEVLEKLGCDYGQGYHYSRPVTMQQIIERFGKKP